MIDSIEWIDPHTMLPGYFEIVYVRLRSYPEKIYRGCYCGLTVWKCVKLCRTVSTNDILEWAELRLGDDPFEEDSDD